MILRCACTCLVLLLSLTSGAQSDGAHCFVNPDGDKSNSGACGENYDPATACASEAQGNGRASR